MINTFYLGFDLTLLQQPKFIATKRQLGHEGIGVYFELCLKQAIYPNYKIKISDIEDLAFDIRCEKDVILKLIELGVFQSDQNYFWSPDVLQKMLDFDDLRKRKSKAGKKGNEKRWSGKQEPKTSESHNDRSAIAEVSQTIAPESQYNIIEYNIIEYNKIESKENNPEDSNKVIDFLKQKIENPQALDTVVAILIKELGINIDTTLAFLEWYNAQWNAWKTERLMKINFTIKDWIKFGKPKPKPEPKEEEEIDTSLNINPATGKQWTADEIEEYHREKEKTYPLGKQANSDILVNQFL